MFLLQKYPGTTINNRVIMRIVLKISDRMGKVMKGYVKIPNKARKKLENKSVQT
jgi:hypothetical protein